jgi:hypothetical protein
MTEEAKCLLKILKLMDRRITTLELDIALLQQQKIMKEPLAPRIPNRQELMNELTALFNKRGKID